MIRHGLGVALPLLLALGLQACVTRADLNAEQQRLNEANKALADKDWPKVRAATEAYIDARAFGHVTEKEQFNALRAGAALELNHGDKQIGYGYLSRAVLMPEAGAKEWFDLTQRSAWLDHPADTPRGLIVLAQRWPDQILQLDKYILASALKTINSMPPEQRLETLWQLYCAKFTLRWGIEPELAWRELGLLLLERTRLKDAIDVSRRITGPEALISLRADRRFDEVVSADPPHFDIEAAAKLAAKRAQQLSDAHPNLLELKVTIAFNLMRLRDYSAALAATDEWVLEIASTNFPRRLYSDYDDQYRMLLEARALLLEKLGRADEALKEMQRASRMTEDGRKNVSQVIVLAAMYCRANRPKDALTALGDLGSLNDNGYMELEFIKLKASLQLHDEAQVGLALKFLAQYRADAPSIYELALVHVGQMDAAAQSLIVRLMQPNQRPRALGSVQDFPLPPVIDSEHSDPALWKSLIERDDVRAAASKVGRVEHYQIETIE